MTANVLRERFDRGDSSIGTRILTPWAGLVEVLGGTGHYDYVEFLAEYAPHDLHDLENIVRAAELHGLSTMAKIDGANRTYVAQRCLAAGVENFLFSDIRTVADAHEAVRAVRPEPEGDAGIRMDRRIGYVAGDASMPALHEGVVERGRAAVVALMIEKRRAVEDLEAILNLEGVDAVVFGPSDYSLSVDAPGRIDEPVVTDAERRTLGVARERGVEPIVEIAESAAADRYRDDFDVRHFNLGVDVGILDDWWRTQGAVLRECLDGR